MQTHTYRAVGLCILVGWWPMMACHELGHIVAAWHGGGTIESVELRPWQISQTVRHGSTHPELDIWAGPLTGMVLPLLIWLTVRRRPLLAQPLRWFAGLCLIGNGLYLSAGTLGPDGDLAELAALQAPLWPALVVGICATLLGLWLWHVASQPGQSAESN